MTHPVRIIKRPEGAEIVFTVRQIDLTDAEFARDIATVETDPDTLKHHPDGT